VPGTGITTDPRVVSAVVKLAKEAGAGTITFHIKVSENPRQLVRQIRNLGVKEAPFYVLIGANMPCILIEVSFISNKLEERRLRDERYLDELVSGITEGIALYMKEIGQTPAV